MTGWASGGLGQDGSDEYCILQQKRADLIKMLDSYKALQDKTVAELRKTLTCDDAIVVDEARLLIGKREVRELESEAWKFLDNEDSDLRETAAATLGGLFACTGISRSSPF